MGALFNCLSALCLFSYVARKKVGMPMKYPNHTLQTNSRHHKEDPHAAMSSV